MNSKIAWGFGFLCTWVNVSCITSSSNKLSREDLLGNWLYVYPFKDFTQRIEYSFSKDSVISRSWGTGTFVDSLTNNYENAYWTDTTVYVDWKFDGDSLVLENGTERAHAVSVNNPALHQVYRDTGFREAYTVKLINDELRLATNDSLMDAGLYLPLLKQP